MGERHADYATGLNQLALLLIMQGNPGSAEPLLRDSLRVRREALGDGHPDCATTASSLGGLLWARGEFHEAESLLRQAADLRIRHLGNDHPKTLMSLNSLDQLVNARRELKLVDDIHASPLRPAAAPAPRDSGVSTVDLRITPDVTPAAPAPPAGAIRPPSDSPDGPASAPAPRHTPTPATPYPDPGVEAPHESFPDSQTAELPAAPTLDELVGAHQELERVFGGLATRLGDAARRFQSPGDPLPDALTSDLRAARSRYDSLRQHAATLAASVGVPTPAAGPASLQDVAALFPRIRDETRARAASEKTRRSALDVLGGVSRLACAGTPDFAPLSACQARAAALAAEIAAAPPSALPDAAARLAAGSEEFSALRNLASADDSASDADWSAWLDRVDSAFGQALSTAAARGRIAEIPRKPQA